MKKIKDEILFCMVRDFLLTFLPQQKNYSKNTIRSYQKVLDMFLDFVKIKLKIELSELTFEMLNQRNLFDFLDYIENERNCSINTRNQRLNCIRSFFSYAADMNPMLIAYRADIAKVPLKKETNAHFIQVMSEDAVHSLLESPNTQTMKGLRDQLIMTFLYDSACRVQEIANIKLSDLTVGKESSVLLHGKGRKIRPVPLQENTVLLLKHYMKIFHPSEDFTVDKPLFYVVRGQTVKRMTEDNIRKMLKYYASKAKLKNAEIPDRVHPHLLRHSRAMHLYKHGMRLPIISEWLGHSQLETTLIYANADTEMKRKAMQQSLKGTTLSSHINQNRYTVSNDDVLKQLFGLK